MSARSFLDSNVQSLKGLTVREFLAAVDSAHQRSRRCAQYTSVRSVMARLGALGIELFPLVPLVVG